MPSPAFGQYTTPVTPSPRPTPRQHPMQQALSLLASLFNAGGWVMYPLLLLSILAGAIALERAAFWIALSRPGRAAWVTRAAAALRRGDTQTARTLAASDRSLYSHFVEVLLDRGPSEAAAVEGITELRPRIERFTTTLSTIITAAPMLGILGTVTGIITSFRLLGGPRDTVVDPAAVASGIAEALYTTAFGLIIAIGALFPYMAIKAAADRCLTRLEVLTAAAIAGLAPPSAAAAAPNPAPRPAKPEPPGPAATAPAPPGS